MNSSIKRLGRLREGDIEQRSSGQAMPLTGIDRARIIVIGMGPVGIRAVQELLRFDGGLPIAIFGAERWKPYNRVRLSSLLAGQATLEDLDNELNFPEGSDVVQYDNCSVVAIDRAERTITDSLGRLHRYRKLILATGSRPRIPPIPNIRLPGVYTFRDLDDAEKLFARRARSRHAMILGAGLLGLETARAMQRAHTRVTVIDHSTHPMSRQLDAKAGERLREKLMDLGMGIILADGIEKVLGERQVEGVQLKSGRRLACDTIVLCAGIVPNIELAQKTGLSYGRGIQVNDFLQTADPDIYAVGECAEHRGKLYGIVAPGFEQAAVMARHLTGGKARYRGSTACASLKVVGHKVFSLGRVGEAEAGTPAKEYCFATPDVYRRLVVHRDRLVGVIALGDWPEQRRIQEALENRRRVWPWQLRRFVRTGYLWPQKEDQSVLHWPAQATVCNCTGVKRGQLDTAIKKQGCSTLSSLSAMTGAASVCGSCKPLLAQLLGGLAALEPVRGHKTLFTIALLCFASAAGFFLWPAIPYGDTVQRLWEWDVLWRDNFYKQLSGYALLGFSMGALLLSLRKRIRWFCWGDFALWRILHVSVSALAVVTLVIHSGLRQGNQLNSYLMLSFTGLILTGALAGLLIATEHRLSASAARRLRSRLIWLHILLGWPLPVLLGFHIVKTYYF